MPPRSYLPQVLECLRDTLRQIERDGHQDSPTMQEFKRKILLLIADLERQDDELSA